MRLRKLLLTLAIGVILLGACAAPVAPPAPAETPPPPPALGKTIVVTSTADSGSDTLRQALLDVQSGDSITFDPTVFPPGAPTTIYVSSELPAISQGNLTIDASNAGVILDGSHIGEEFVPGLEIVSNGNAVQGLQFVNFAPGAGISLSSGAQHNLIGGDSSIGSGPLGQGNLASRGDIGICLGGDGTSFNTITGNLIGTDASGADDWGNSGSGMWIEDGANHNTIGPDNIIAYNNHGIEIRDSNSLGNTVTQNSIYDNEGEGIYLWEGGNTELPAPLIFDFNLDAGDVTGTACPNCAIQVYSDSSNQGEVYEGETIADDAGAFSFNKGAPFNGPHLMATATDADGNTSAFSLPTPTPTPAPTPTPIESPFQSWAPSPLGLAITPDGKTAYIPFELDDPLLVVDLSTFTTVESIDVSSAGSMLRSSFAVLSPHGERLYVANSGTQNVMIINTENNSVEEVLPVAPLWGDSISISGNGTTVYTTSPDGLHIVNTSDNSYYQISIPGIFFESVEPSAIDPKLLYCIGKDVRVENIVRWVFFTFNLYNNSIERQTTLPSDALGVGAPYRFTINSDETTAYFGSMSIIADKGVGNFNVFDLNSFQLLVSTPIECGVSDFAINEGTGKIYIIGFWSGGGSPQRLYIREWDISTSSVVEKILVSPSSDQRAIAIDPTDSNYLYMTEGDFNLLRKVEISTGKEVGSLRFNKEDVSPYNIIRGDNVGYVVCHRSRDIYKLDLNSGQLMNSLALPSGASPSGGYYQDKLYLSGGRHIYSVDPSDGSIIDTFDIGRNIIPITFTFFNDKMATISFEPGGMVGKELLLFDAKTMTLLKSIDLPPEPHGKSVIASPDGSKFYVARGPMNGPTVITIFDASTLNVINTIEIPFGMEHNGTTSFLEADFDLENRILYLSGFLSVYIIDMDTDKLIGTLDVIDSYKSQNIGGWSCTGLAGVVLSATKDKLFVISGDGHTMHTYDLVNSTWMPKITNLKGYFVTDTDHSPDRRYLYTVNEKSDSITMVDLASGDVVRVIRL